MNLLCPNCQKPLTVPEQYAGQPMRCPLCAGTFTVPALPQTPAPPPAPAAPSDVYGVQGAGSPPPTGAPPQPDLGLPEPPPAGPSPITGTPPPAGPPGAYTDEYANADFQPDRNDVDQRTMSSSSPYANYPNVTGARGYIRDAIAAEQAFEPTKTADIGELFFSLASSPVVFLGGHGMSGVCS